jgi:hypothetical protein
MASPLSRKLSTYKPPLTSNVSLGEMNIIIELKSFLVLWLKFFRFIVPINARPAPEAIGRALGFLFVTEIVFSLLVSLVFAVIHRNSEIQILPELSYTLKFFGFLAIGSFGAYLSMKTNEDTHIMNLKIYAAIGAVPNTLVSLPSLGAGNIMLLSMVLVPSVSVIAGYVLFKKYPEKLKN